MLRPILLAATIEFAACAAPAGSAVECDVCVFGGTSGGVVAAVQAARMGKSVVLIEPGRHVGGMSSGGLGLTDHGNIESVGGVSLEFYRRVGLKYGFTNPYWASSNHKWYFDPGVAETVFLEMLAEEKVPVYYGQQLASVTKTNQRITEIRMTCGLTFRGRMFVDTTYEGDLMAGAGVTFTVGRESREAYDESLAGVVNIGNGGYDFDPYVQPGNPASGVLPLVSPAGNTNLGAGGPEVQSYNFRLCVTKVATNQIPIHLQPPPNYSEGRYELLGRYIQARLAKDGSVVLADLLTLSGMTPNAKVDVNNGPGGVSTDFVGESKTWATNTYAGREVIRQAHEDYIRGLLFYLANASAVPASVRNEMRSYGLAKDEFTDNNGWPHQLYVREARRMVGDYVTQQHNSVGRRIAPDSVGLASYSIDSHACQRFPMNGLTYREGGMFSPVPRPFPISYRSIVPRASECDNLFVTFALSSSHVAFGACRMEPVFMITSQSAATAAALAIDQDLAVQQLDYQRLALQLAADGQILTWDWGIVSTNTSTNSIIIDNKDPGVIVLGSWSVSSETDNAWGPNYLHDGNSGTGKSVMFPATIATNGVYEVDAWWTSHANRATNVAIDIAHRGITTRVFANQTANGGVWVRLLTTSFFAGDTARVTITNGNSSGYVIADAVRFAPVSLGSVPPPNSVIIDNADPGVALVGDWTTSASLPGYWGANYFHDRNSGLTNGKSATFTANIPETGPYHVQAWWTALDNRASNVPIEIVHPAGKSRVFADQTRNGSMWVTLLTTNYTAGFEATVVVTNHGANGYVIADAVRFIPVNSSDSFPAVQMFAVDSLADEFQTNRARVTVVRSGDAAQALVINYSVAGTAQDGTDYITLPGSINLSPGMTSANILITPIADGTSEGPETILLTLAPSQAHTIGPSGGAVITILDSDPLQAPIIRFLESSSVGYNLYFTGNPSTTYEVQRSTDVQGPWSKIASVLTAVSGSGAFMETNPPPSDAFYRLVDAGKN